MDFEIVNFSYGFDGIVSSNAYDFRIPPPRFLSEYSISVLITVCQFLFLENMLFRFYHSYSYENISWRLI